jgi:hypothetical protein
MNAKAIRPECANQTILLPDAPHPLLEQSLKCAKPLSVPKMAAAFHPVCHIGTAVPSSLPSPLRGSCLFQTSYIASPTRHMGCYGGYATSGKRIPLTGCALFLLAFEPGAD